MVENSLGEHVEISRGASAGSLLRPRSRQIWHQPHPPRSEADSMTGGKGTLKHNHGDFRNGSTAFAFNSTLWLMSTFFQGI